MPYFSIITVSFNAADFIERTVRSALSQTFTDFEILIQDGASTDGTLDAIPQDERICVVSERDGGIYDGMNRAIRRSRGKYCIFMNCGDVFASDDVLQTVWNATHTLTEDSVVYGNYSIDGVLHAQPNHITDFYLYRTPLCHQSMFIAGGLFKTIGLYDCRYKILADFNFTVKAFRAGIPFLHVPLAVCRYQGGGVSESKKGIVLKNSERQEILKREYSRLQRVKYELILFFSLRRLRIWLFSGHAPRWLTVMYRKLVNFINRNS